MLESEAGDLLGVDDASGEEIFERVRVAAPYFTSLNVDMIFNFPAQTEEILRRDLELVIEAGSGQTTFYPLMA